jgi:hypothetical protein
MTCCEFHFGNSKDHERQSEQALQHHQICVLPALFSCECLARNSDWHPIPLFTSFGGIKLSLPHNSSKTVGCSCQVSNALNGGMISEFTEWSKGDASGEYDYKS